MTDSENSNSFLGSQILDIDDKFDDDDEEQITDNQKIKKTVKNDDFINTNISASKNNNLNFSKPIPFIIFQDGKFIIQEQAKKVLSQNVYQKIGIISVVGKYRTGKSFLLNRVILNAPKNSGFEVSPTIRPCTKGIWLWPEPLIIQNNHSTTPFPCFLIDTEGLGAYNEEINHDTKIFLIAVLISSLFIYNSFGPIDEMTANNLSFILNLSKSIKLKGLNNEDNEDEFAQYFPTLLWLLRDFSLKLEDKEGNVITEKQYLENALENISGNSDIINEKNNIRNIIKAYFPEKDCFVMVRPIESEEDLQNLQNIPDEKLRKEFVEQSKIFKNKVMKKVKPKIFKKKELNGSMLLEFIQDILNSINSGSIPVIENSWKYVIQNICNKNSKEMINKFVLDINKFRQENKDKKDFVKNMKKFIKKTKNNCISQFIKDCDLYEDNKNEYIEKIENKLNNEIIKFEKENEKIFEEKFNEEIDKLSKEFISNFSNDLYKKNQYQFFSDFETFKERAYSLTPYFPQKNDIFFDKIIIIIKKFTDLVIEQIKNKKEKEIIELKDENEKQKKKINNLILELTQLNDKNNANLSKLNNDLMNERLKYNSIEEKMNNILNSKKLEQDNYLKKVEEIKNNYEIKIKNLLMTKTQLEADLKFNNEELIVVKMNNDKMTSLNNQKFIYLEREINNLKEKNNLLQKEYKVKEDNLNKEIILLKEQNKKLKIDNKKDNINNDKFNTNINNLINYFKENLKAQNEENKNMLEKMMKVKQKNSANGNELFKNYKELIAKHSELKIDLNTKDNQIKNLEEQISILNTYKEICNKIKSIQCINCEKYFNYDIFKEHYKNCKAHKNKSSNKKDKNDIIPNGNEDNKFILNPEKLKIKIIKGYLKNDELGKPYLEYIMDINYSSQNWRINKRFNQFANLYKSIKSFIKGNIQMPQSANIFINFGGTFNGSFHENKIQQLEKFIKDLSEIQVICNSKIFKKFIEFEQNFEEDNDAIYSDINQQKEKDTNNQLYKEISENNGGFNNGYNLDNNKYRFNKIKNKYEDL